MTYVAQASAEMPPVFITTMHAISAWARQGDPGSAPASGTLATNRVTYVPFTLSRSVTVYRYFWLNGATASTNNLQVGVYDTEFTRLNAGTSTTSSGANVCQFDNVTDFALGPGRYYMALWISGTTATVFRVSAAARAGIGVYYETSGSLPSTGTPADPGTQAPQIPVFGLALRATDP